MKTSSIVIVVIVALALIAGMWSYSTRTTEALNNLSDCVVETATEEGYPDNPYSEEAWNLFAGVCLDTDTFEEGGTIYQTQSDGTALPLQ